MGKKERAPVIIQLAVVRSTTQLDVVCNNLAGTEVARVPLALEAEDSCVRQKLISCLSDALSSHLSGPFEYILPNGSRLLEYMSEASLRQQLSVDVVTGPFRDDA